MKEHLILAGDIGGTKTRLAFFRSDGNGLNCLVQDVFDSPAHSGLGEIVNIFTKAQSVQADSACFGVAGVIKRGRALATNLPWVVDASHLAGVLDLKDVSLINDVEANAYGIDVLSKKDFFVLNEGEPNSEGNCAIISAGTGLGEAGMCWDGKRHRPFASEGGHADFAPIDDLQIELLNYLRAKFGHVSWERMVSGPGLYNLYQFLRDTDRGIEPAWLADELRKQDPGATISQLALEGKNSLCEEALDLFISLYGAEAGNQALKLMATGGVYLGGGIAPKIIERLKGQTFMKAFVDKGRMQNLMQAMPVRVILNDRTALLGAANFAVIQNETVSPQTIQR
jgi:glucokinase